MDFESVRDKVVIVTGGGSGIGKSIAVNYGRHGMKVVCADINASKGEETVDLINEKGGESVFCHTDVGDSESIERLVKSATERFGRLDGIVNNAGIGLGGFPLHEYSVAECENILSLNLKSVFSAMKYAAEAILKFGSDGGFIINIASVAGLVPQSGQSLYTATKHGVVGITKSAAIEYAPYNLTVNAICPGYIRTPIFGNAPKEAMQYFSSCCPAGRMGTPKDCANLALFLASDMARYISGASIPVDGALSAGARNLMQWKKQASEPGS